MFKLRRPTAAEIEKRIAAAPHVSEFTRGLVKSLDPEFAAPLPFLFSLDFSTSSLSRGEDAFLRAKAAFSRWVMFDIGWVRVANPSAAIRVGERVAVGARTLGLWTLNVCEIVSVVDEQRQFGFVYATTNDHVEEGVEQFLISHDEGTDEVRYSLKAISRPRAELARIGFPISRAFQHRFARDSHVRITKAVAGSTF